jgi:dTDP-4-amino-4,6-dideoxygalactose transaminase
LRALGIKADDEVIVPACTFIATWLAVSQCGARPVPVEPCHSGFNIDPQRLERAISPRTRAIVVVHLYGIPANMPAIMTIAERYGLPVIEDAAQAHGAMLHGSRTGTLGTVAAFSFYPGKNLGALGDAGAVVTNDEVVANNVCVLRNYGSRVKYEHLELGYNARLDELQAALLREKLRILDDDNRARADIVERYRHGLNDTAFGLPETPAGANPAWHLFAVRHPQRDAVRQHLAEIGVETLIHYPVACHLQPAYQHLGYERGSLPLTEQIHDEVLSLPLWPGLTTGQIEHVIDACRRIG